MDRSGGGERGLIGDDGGGHALAGVAIAVFDAHPEFGEGAEEGHFFGGDLAGGNEGDGVLSVGGLDFFEFVGKDLAGEIPGDFASGFIDEFLEEGGGGAFGRF